MKLSPVCDAKITGDYNFIWKHIALSHSAFYQDIRTFVEKAENGQKYFKCGGCFTAFNTLAEWKTHLLENAFLQCSRDDTSVLSFYATKCRLNAIKANLDLILKQKDLISARLDENDMAQIQEKFNDSYKFVLGENDQRKS